MHPLLLNSAHSLAFSPYRNILFLVFLRKKTRLSLPELAHKRQNSPASTAGACKATLKTFCTPAASKKLLSLDQGFGFQKTLGRNPCLALQAASG